jgi:hypothetical protein
MSTIVSAVSWRSRSSVCTCSTKSVIVFGIGQVALERGRAHQQVVAHQPAGELGLARLHAEPRAQLERDLGAEHRVVAAAALGDVVQQRRHVEHAAAGELGMISVASGWSWPSSPRSICASRPIARMVCSSTV